MTDHTSWLSDCCWSPTLADWQAREAYLSRQDRERAQRAADEADRAAHPERWEATETDPTLIAVFGQQWRKRAGES